MVRSEDGEIIIPERDIQSEAESCLAIIEPLLPYDPEGFGYAYRVYFRMGWDRYHQSLMLYRPSVPEPPKDRWWRKAYEGPKRDIMSEDIEWSPDDPGSIPNGLEEAAARINVRLVMKALPEVEQ